MCSLHSLYPFFCLAFCQASNKTILLMKVLKRNFIYVAADFWRKRNEKESRIFLAALFVCMNAHDLSPNPVVIMDFNIFCIKLLFFSFRSCSSQSGHPWSFQSDENTIVVFRLAKASSSISLCPIQQCSRVSNGLAAPLAPSRVPCHTATDVAFRKRWKACACRKVREPLLCPVPCFFSIAHCNAYLDYST